MKVCAPRAAYLILHETIFVSPHAHASLHIYRFFDLVSAENKEVDSDLVFGKNENNISTSTVHDYISRIHENKRISIFLF